MTSSSWFSLPSLDICANIALRWTPRMIGAAVAGYYSLGIAYERGVMAAIDRIVIRILLPHVGYLGLGAIMPTAQWYAAVAVRTVAALAAALLYDMIEKMVIAAYRYFIPKEPQEISGAPVQGWKLPTDGKSV